MIQNLFYVCLDFKYRCDHDNNVLIKQYIEVVGVLEKLQGALLIVQMDVLLDPSINYWHGVCKEFVKNEGVHLMHLPS